MPEDLAGSQLEEFEVAGAAQESLRAIRRNRSPRAIGKLVSEPRRCAGNTGLSEMKCESSFARKAAS